MKMTLSIKLYECLEKIRKINRIPKGEWAKACNWDNARISELNKLLSMRKKGDNTKIGVEWTYSKFIELTRGLKKIMGEAQLKASVAHLLATCDDLDSESELILRVLAMTADEQTRANTVLKTMFPVEK